ARRQESAQRRHGPPAEGRHPRNPGRLPAAPRRAARHRRPGGRRPRATAGRPSRRIPQAPRGATERRDAAQAGRRRRAAYPPPAALALLRGSVRTHTERPPQDGPASLGTVPGRLGTNTRYFFGDDQEGLAAYANVVDGTARKKFPGWTSAAIKAEDGYVFT